MNDFALTLGASRDLEEVIDFLGPDNPRVDEVVAGIKSRRRILNEMPDSGRNREDLSHGLRSGLAGPYLIFYRKAEDHIQILRIIHGRRDVQAIFRKNQG